MIEGGAVDWGGHSNRLDQVVGEMIGFNQAVQVVFDWVDDPASDAAWSNTLVVVTGDHETGYLTAGPGLFPDQPLGVVDAATLGQERLVSGSSRRASWDDQDANGAIDAGETVHWAWNSGSHTNSLIPLYARGVGDYLFGQLATSSDPVRGAYLDNTDVFEVMDSVLYATPAGSGVLNWSTCAGQTLLGPTGTALPAGSLVELWDVSTRPPQRLDTAVIGAGGQPAGRFADSVILNLASYTLQVRAYSAAAPVHGAAASCAMLRPGFAPPPTSASGLAVTLDALAPTDVCIDGAQIPATAYAAGAGGCQAPVLPVCGDFTNPWGVGLEDINAVAAHWGETAAPGSLNALYDLNDDYLIDIVDIMITATQWSWVCL